MYFQKGFCVLSFFRKLFNIKNHHNETAKLNLTHLKKPYPDNVHRSGWNGVIDALSELHNPEGIIFDSYLDETFDWGNQNRIPYRKPWIGFLHFPNELPEWHPDRERNDKVFTNSDFRESLKNCKGIFTLSEQHSKAIQKKLDVPVSHLWLPTETPELQWSIEKFRQNNAKKVIQLGFFLRKMHAIYLLPPIPYQKVLLKPNSDKIDAFMALEKRHTLQDVEINYLSVETLTFLTNDAYDTLLSENIAFTHLYNASANNVVVECMVRNTPLLVNPLESVVEYLGEAYPFYFNSLEEAAQKLEDEDLIYQTHIYLKNHPDKRKLSYDYFVESLKNSDIYKNISISSQSYF